MDNRAQEKGLEVHNCAVQIRVTCGWKYNDEYYRTTQCMAIGCISNDTVITQLGVGDNSARSGCVMLLSN